MPFALNAAIYHRFCRCRNLITFSSRFGSGIGLKFINWRLNCSSISVFFSPDSPVVLPETRT
nr:MAG TPA: hypothetical protein [Caudoviricetes sp.]